VLPPVNATGQVVLTATSPVWVRVYDAADKVLFEKEMIAGERFTVPPDANNPQIRTGRADLISVTVDGKAVATLGPAQRTVKDVGISAAALAARTPAVVGAAVNPSAPAAVLPVRP
jgi:cytoskeleton protein RodZ